MFERSRRICAYYSNVSACPGTKNVMFYMEKVSRKQKSIVICVCCCWGQRFWTFLRILKIGDPFVGHRKIIENPPLRCWGKNAKGQSRSENEKNNNSIIGGWGLETERSGDPTGNPSPAPSTQHPHRTHRTHDTTDQWREIVWWLGRSEANFPPH